MDVWYLNMGSSENIQTFQLKIFGLITNAFRYVTDYNIQYLLSLSYRIPMKIMYEVLFFNIYCYSIFN